MQSSNPYAYAHGPVAAQAVESERSAFIQKTYVHLAAAIGVFVLLEVALVNLIPFQLVTEFLAKNPYSWLIVLGGFMGVSFLANYWANSSASPTLQYAGLSLYVVAEAVIFFPLIAYSFGIDPTGGIAGAAALTTLIVFGGLTGVVFFTGANLSWMGRFLSLAGLAALAAIIASIVFGFSLGLLFSAAMVTLASGYILYETSNIMHNYRTSQHVAASLALFASVALLFWYILRIFISLSEE